MSKFRTCLGCLFEKQACGERDKMRDKTAGLGITSMKWRCGWRRSKYRPGDLVNVSIVTHYWGQDDDGRAHMSTDTFHGVVIQVAAVPSKAVVFIQPGALGVHGEAFQPSKDGNGFCRLPVAYLAPREGVPEAICAHCQNPVSLLGHAEHCDLSGGGDTDDFLAAFESPAILNRAEADRGE